MLEIPIIANTLLAKPFQYMGRLCVDDVDIGIEDVAHDAISSRICSSGCSLFN